jgi:hypothetical protein
LAAADLDSGRARLSYRRAEEIFNTLTKPLAHPDITDPDQLAAAPGWTLHDLRHSALTHAAENGANQAQRGPTLVFANHSHLQKDRSRLQLAPGWVPEEGRALEWWSAGAIVGAHLGDGYAVITSALGAAPQHGIDPPPVDILEGRLSALPDSHYLLAAEPLAAALAGRDGELRQRTGNPNYSPLDPGSLDGTDAVIFHKYLDPEGRGVARTEFPSCSTTSCPPSRRCRAAARPSPAVDPVINTRAMRPPRWSVMSARHHRWDATGARWDHTGGPLPDGNVRPAVESSAARVRATATP